MFLCCLCFNQRAFQASTRPTPETSSVPNALLTASVTLKDRPSATVRKASTGQGKIRPPWPVHVSTTSQYKPRFRPFVFMRTTRLSSKTSWKKERYLRTQHWRGFFFYVREFCPVEFWNVVRTRSTCVFRLDYSEVPFKCASSFQSTIHRSSRLKSLGEVNVFKWQRLSPMFIGATIS